MDIQLPQESQEERSRLEKENSKLKNEMAELREQHNRLYWIETSRYVQAAERVQGEQKIDERATGRKCLENVETQLSESIERAGEIAFREALNNRQQIKEVATAPTITKSKSRNEFSKSVLAEVRCRKIRLEKKKPTRTLMQQTHRQVSWR